MKTVLEFEAAFAPKAEAWITMSQTVPVTRRENAEFSAAFAKLRQTWDGRTQAGIRVYGPSDDRYVQGLHGVIDSLIKRVDIVSDMFAMASGANGDALVLVAEMGKRIQELEAELAAQMEPEPEEPIHGLDPYRGPYTSFEH